MRQAIAKCMAYKHGVGEAADEREFLIRSQCEVDKQPLLGQAEHYVDGVKRFSPNRLGRTWQELKAG